MFTMLCAFIVRSTVQPRRSRAERIMAVISLKNGHFLIYAYPCAWRLTDA